MPEFAQLIEHLSFFQCRDPIGVNEPGGEAKACSC